MNDIFTSNKIREFYAADSTFSTLIFPQSRGRIVCVYACMYVRYVRTIKSPHFFPFRGVTSNVTLASHVADNRSQASKKLRVHRDGI
ncbi:hypothetical protein PUN28_019315 [Cardiocondyla obscurior]|uniref:Uncharacterized protein n=1 Tax=Cardiocondyla obscurior TaxID=286306 RepID=A0AAW2EAY2_9HYME